MPKQSDVDNENAHTTYNDKLLYNPQLLIDMISVWNNAFLKNRTTANMHCASHSTRAKGRATARIASWRARRHDARRPRYPVCFPKYRIVPYLAVPYCTVFYRTTAPFLLPTRVYLTTVPYRCFFCTLLISLLSTICILSFSILTTNALHVCLLEKWMLFLYIMPDYLYLFRLLTFDWNRWVVFRFF